MAGPIESPVVRPAVPKDTARIRPARVLAVAMKLRSTPKNGDKQRPTSLHPAPPSGWMHCKDHLQAAPDSLKNRVQQRQQVQGDRNYGGQA
ncbi:hypothetical protein OSTOST_01823 [Ostertagia ostertagi]